MSYIDNRPSSIFYNPGFWSYVNGKFVAVTYHDGTVLLGTIEFKKEMFPRISGATITKPGMGEKWLGNVAIDMSQVKKVEDME